jgi:pyruvate dehydrogenase E2 component (dihydrolipoamide acetyltransferase)/2-oxoisovalerate dehydrogenase E2 component (dihydrolipoyl transacylase)
MDFPLPELGEGVYEAELVRWLVKPGDVVQRGQALLEVLTDKATMEVPSPFAGKITALNAKEGAMVKVGDLVLAYGGSAEESAPAAAPDPKAVMAPLAVALPVENGSSVPVKASPSVRLMARKLGIDINRIHGSGPGSRILIEDLATVVPVKAHAPRPTNAPDYGTPGTRIKMAGLRRRIAEHMVLSKRTIPHYTYVDECDVTDLVRLRAGLRDAAAKIGVKMTYLPFFVKAVVAGLKAVPLVNSSLDEVAGEIVLHKGCHVGVAVATAGGLVVPVIHDADKKDLFQIAREIQRLTDEVRAGKAKREDLIGGTFSVTSIGSIGGLIATPIVNHPEVGILGIGKIVKRPVFDGAGQIRAADMVYLSLSFDHRVVDGAVGAVFGNAVIEALKHAAGLLVPSR